VRPPGKRADRPRRAAGALFALAWLAWAAGALGCDADVSPPPGSCQAGERVCYFEPVQARELALRCNNGEVDGAIWIIDEVCDESLGCQGGVCVAP
jgi:hypothetical protein